jgi:hypothetical protein
MKARLLVPVALLLTCVLCGAALASRGDAVAPRYVSEAASKRAAKAHIAQYMAALRLPPGGAIVKDGSPLVAKRLRGGRYPFISSWARHLYWKTRFAFVGTSIDRTIGWLAHHPPAGSKLTYTTSGPRGAVHWYRCLWFEWPNGRPRTDEGMLTACGTRAHGGTSLRFDAQAVWLEGRSRFEHIPGGSRYLEVTARFPAKPDRLAIVTDVGLIDHLVAVLNSLPVVQRTSYSCPHGIEGYGPAHPDVRLIFRPRRGGQPIARIIQSLPVESGCRPLHISIRGRPQRSLDEGWLLIRALDKTIARARVRPDEAEGSAR